MYLSNFTDLFPLPNKSSGYTLQTNNISVVHLVHCKHRGSCFFALLERASRKPFIELVFVQKYTNPFADSTAICMEPVSMHERQSSMNLYYGT